MKTLIPNLLLFIFASHFSFAQIQHFTNINNGDIDGDGIEDFSISNSHSSYSNGDYVMHSYIGTFSPKNKLQIHFGSQTLGTSSFVEFKNYGDTIGANQTWTSSPKTLYLHEGVNYVDRWKEEDSAFIGIRIQNGDLFRYGWLRISTTFNCYAIEGAIQETSEIPIFAGEGINSIKSFKLTAADKKNNGNWSDIEINFLSPFHTSAVQEYRIFAFENTTDLSISVDSLLNIPLTNYQKVEPGEFENRTVLASDFVDADGNDLNSNKEYKICILSVSNNTDNFPHAFNLSPAFSIETILPDTEKPTVIDAGDNGNSKDLSIHFPRNPREAMMEEYRILILPLNSALTFDLFKAQQVNIGNYYSVLPNNDSIYYVQNELLKDIYGNKIEDEKLYQTFIYSVPDNIIANVGSLSTGSNLFCLGKPNYFYAGQKEGKQINYLDYNPDIEGDYLDSNLDFDFDNDGKTDLQFYEYSNWRPTSIDEKNKVTTGENVQIIVSNHEIATNISEFTPINKFCNWAEGSYFLRYYNSGWNRTVSKGEFHPFGILGFRKISPTDTIYGWLNIGAYYNVIKEIAWQNNSMRFFPDTIETSFQLYPNPNIERILRIAIKEFDPINEYFVDIINSSGNLINTIIINQKLTKISVAHLQRGLYYIRFRSPDKQETQKIIVL